jgi:SAM-dependent methyltransferase
VDIVEHNREAWNRLVGWQNRWTVPVEHEVVERARRGDIEIRLTPRPAPQEWFPALTGASVLCLASGGGQQGPVLAAAGSIVTVFDNSDNQLEQDRRVAKREGLQIRSVRGDMADLSVFADAAFDLIVHPVSNVFVADVRPVWREAYRVLKPGGTLLAGFCNGLVHLFDAKAYDEGRLEIRHALPYSDVKWLGEEGVRRKREGGEPLEFGHTLEDQIGGQIAAGFVINGFYEDKNDPLEPLDHYASSYIATRGVKPPLHA